MAEINSRIEKCIKSSGLTKTAFAERINVSQQYISKLVREGTPSDRTLADIAREFNINETWLRSGEGEMFAPVNRDEEIAAFLGRVLGDSASFKHRFVSMLSRLDEAEWVALEKMARSLTEEKKED